MPSAGEVGWRALARRWRFRWSANAYYQAWVLRRVPPHAATALDVGCGLGELAVRIARLGVAVDALDVDAEMIARARERHATEAVRWTSGDVFAGSGALRPEGYDLVVAAASLHQEPIRRTLDRLRSLVRPGGSLLLVGLYRAESWRDTAVSAAALPLHVARGLFDDVRGRNARRLETGVPLAAPADTLREIRRVAGQRLPGARVRRRLFWRVTLEWRALAEVTPARALPR